MLHWWFARVSCSCFLLKAYFMAFTVNGVLWSLFDGKYYLILWFLFHCLALLLLIYRTLLTLSCLPLLNVLRCRHRRLLSVSSSDIFMAHGGPPLPSEVGCSVTNSIVIFCSVVCFLRDVVARCKSYLKIWPCLNVAEFVMCAFLASLTISCRTDYVDSEMSNYD